MEIPVTSMPALLREMVLNERKKLIADGIIKEETIETFHLFTEGLQGKILSWVESLRKPQVHGSGDEFDFMEEYPDLKRPETPKDYKDKVEAVRIAFTAENFRPGHPAETVDDRRNEAKIGQLKPKSDDELKREAVVQAFTNRQVISETTE
jgi:hypothetical protein